MKTKSFRKDKINLITLGCSKNLVDSEVMMGQLKANNFKVTHEDDKAEANVVIINTCGFIDNAKQESIDTILNYCKLKEAGTIEKLYVTGCLSERYKPDLENEIPDVDQYFGTNDLKHLLNTLGADYKKELVGERLLTTPSHYAYVKISEGCDRPCSFCAIPLMRGVHKSKPIEELVSEIEGLVKNGVKEVLLIAQDSTYYGLDIYKKRSLPELLRKVSDIPGLEWIRLHYAYPSGFPMEILDVITERDNICNYIDMPLQHISDNMLKSMRRGINKEKTLDLVNHIHTNYPDITLRTTLICGYPGETEEDHEELKDFVRESRFHRLGCFTYSHEENTHAFNLEDDVSDFDKARRAEEIMEIQQEISLENNENLIGSVQRVLIDKLDGNYYVGRTKADSPEVDNEVLIEASDNYLSPGSFVNVKITETTDFDLYGVTVNP